MHATNFDDKTIKDKIMKRLFIVVAALVFAAAAVSAQDINSATETYNNGVAALQGGDNAGALALFKEALSQGEACGEDGEELVANCKNVIPGIILSVAKGQINDGSYDDAVTSLKDAAAKAKEYGIESVAEEAEGLIPNALLRKGSTLLKEKKFDAAADAFKEVVAITPEDGQAHLLLGQALIQANKNEEAVAALEQAAANGKEEQAGKLLSTTYLKEAAAALKANKFNEAIEAADKANSYAENAQAYLIAGQAAQKGGKDAVAIDNFEKYLAASPGAKNAGAITFTLAALYQKAGNKAKALENYKKIEGDAQFGAQAKQQIETLSK